MDIEVLGQLTVRERGISIVPSAGKPRQILALLALHAGRAVPVPTLMEEVWGDGIPRSAATTLQTYILQLRRRIVAAVGPGSRMNAKDVLATCFNGYQLTGAVDSFDLREFHRLAERGYEAVESGDPAAASVHLGRALRLWSGPALNDVPVGRVLRTDLVGMEEARMRALRQRIDADLLLGRHSALVPELRTLTAQHPMDENLCAQLMTSLYRSGGTSRALEAFQRLRRTLIDELGIEPSPRVQRLHQAVLLNTPDLEPLREEWTAKLIGRPVAVPST
nr:AfsR/SARP family transcriptional regulator [Streptomyces sp. NBC_00857]